MVTPDIAPSPSASSPSLVWRAWWRLRGREARLNRFVQGVMQLHHRSLYVQPEMFDEECLRLLHLTQQGLSKRPSRWNRNQPPEEALRQELGSIMIALIDGTNAPAEAMTLTLAAGADPDFRENNNSHDTMLGRAARKGQLRFISPLLDAGASPYLADSTNATPWSHILRHRYDALEDAKGIWDAALEALFDHGGLDTLPQGSAAWKVGAYPIWWEAAVLKDVPMLQRFQAAGADLTLRNHHGKTILAAVIEFSEYRYRPCHANTSTVLDCAKWLSQQKGIAMDRVNKHNDDPLGWAVWHDELPLAQWLVSQGSALHPGLILHKNNEPITLALVLVQRFPPTHPMAEWLLSQFQEGWWHHPDASGQTALKYVVGIDGDDLRTTPMELTTDDTHRAWMPYLLVHHEKEVLKKMMTEVVPAHEAVIAPRRRVRL